MMHAIDAWLNRVTLYRLTAYVLIAQLTAAAGLSLLRALALDPFALLFTAGVLVAACWLANTLLARVIRVPANVESSYITALILALILPPVKDYADLPALAVIAGIAMASKYWIAPFRRHIFNPVALAAAIAALLLDREATWWLAALPMLPFTLLGGLLIVRKAQRGALTAAFFGAAMAVTCLISLTSGDGLLSPLEQVVVESPLLFFGTLILTEPLTLPPTLALQIVEGALVGVLFSPQLHLGVFGFTPEAAMLVGNVFAWLVGPKVKHVLPLIRKEHVGADVWDFIFRPDRPLRFAPGQYMEWTLGHPDPDARGNRRYLTLASSPTENEIRVGIKIPHPSSSYKRALLDMKVSDAIVAGQLAGDFTLPRDPAEKVVFVAGGIGITPYRSMIQYLVDRGERRDIVLLYSNRTADEIVYRDVFERARYAIDLRTVYTLTDPTRAPKDWSGRLGRIDAAFVRAEVPDWAERTFYLSGPNAMVDGFEHALREMGVGARRIRKDFFPGF